MFEAIAHNLEILYNFIIDHKQLRLDGINHILSNPDDYIKDLDPDRSTIAIYTEYMKNQYVFGDETIMNALIDKYQLSITLYTKTSVVLPVRDKDFEVVAGKFKRVESLGVATHRLKGGVKYSMAIHLNASGYHYVCVFDLLVKTPSYAISIVSDDLMDLDPVFEETAGVDALESDDLMDLDVEQVFSFLSRLKKKYPFLKSICLLGVCFF